jgi:cell division transport system permease protein
MKFFKTAWKNIRRSPYQAIAAIFIMTLTFLAFSLFSIIFYGSAKVVNYFESKPQVTAFFKDEAKQADIDSLTKDLTKSGLVSGVKFVSKDEALKIYKDQNKNDPLLLDLVTADILPSSLEISTYKIEDLSIASDTLKKSSIVQEVVFQKDVVSTLTSWTNALRKVGVFVVSLLAITSIFIMVIIIGIKVSQKREDIETMRLIGASSWYVRWPFIIEGVFYGVTGAIIGWIVSAGITFWVTPHFSSFLKGIPVFPLSPTFLLELLVIEIFFAILLGTLSSFLAVFRYLK